MGGNNKLCDRLLATINQLTGATEKARNMSDTTAKRSFMVNSCNSSNRDLQNEAQLQAVIDRSEVATRNGREPYAIIIAAQPPRYAHA